MDNLKIGFDPGITGAMALIRGNKVIRLDDMPIMAKASGKGNQVNAAELSSIIRDYIKMLVNDQSISAVIENVHAMPGQGVSSVFSFGKSAGIIEGILCSYAIPYKMISPQKWKRKEGLTGKDKDAARAMCIREHPEVADQLKRKKDIGRADAILIARQ